MTYRLVIATPVDGDPATATVHAGYSAAFAQLMRDPDVSYVPTQIMYSEDIVRARNRAAAFVLRETDATHVLWWDCDVVPHDLSIVRRMLETGKDFIGAPYPRKRLPLEWTFRSDGTTVTNGLGRVLGVGLGFTIMSRGCLQRLTDHYWDETAYTDIMTDGTTHRVGGIFNQALALWGEWRTLLSEDYSAAHRWRAMGEQVWLYLGEGSPLAHVGQHRFLGSAEDLLK